MLKEGRYVAKVIQRTGARSEGQGHPMIVCMYEVARGDCQGQRVQRRAYLHTEETRARTVAELQANGWQGKRVGDLKTLGFRGVGDKLVEIVVRHEPDQNDATRSYARVAFVNRLPELKVQLPTTLEDLAAFDDEVSLGDLERLGGHVDPETGEVFDAERAAAASALPSPIAN